VAVFKAERSLQRGDAVRDFGAQSCTLSQPFSVTLVRK